MVTMLLKKAAATCAHDTGITPAMISVQSLRSGGATALMCANIDTRVIQLLGRWQSDAMLTYLRSQAFNNHGNFSTKMLTGGTFGFSIGSTQEAQDAFIASNDDRLPVGLPENLLDAHTKCEFITMGLLDAPPDADWLTPQPPSP